jgi:ribosomal protein L11 methyltransferase
MPRAWPALALTGGALTGFADAILTILDDFDPTGLEEPSTERWYVYFATASARDRAATSLGEIFARHEITATCIEVLEGDWAARSQASLKAIQVGQLVIAPPWDVPDTPGADCAWRARLIVIEPSMGFGSGHHASTRLCLGALQSLVRAGQHVVDIGSGSGILAIAAARLGATSVTAIDHDRDAIAAARVNIDRNGEASRIALRHADFTELDDLRGDLVVANLSTPILVREATRLLQVAEPGGLLVLAGFLAADEAKVAGAFTEGADLDAVTYEDEWACIVLIANSGVAARGAPSKP